MSLRITIAQASLRGQGLRPDGKTKSTHPVTGAPLAASPSARRFSTSISAPDLLSNTQSSHFILGHPNSNAPLVGNAAVTTGNGLEVDYSLVSTLRIGENILDSLALPNNLMLGYVSVHLGATRGIEILCTFLWQQHHNSFKTALHPFREDAHRVLLA